MKRMTKINRQTRLLYATYAVRGRAAALLAAYVAFDPVGAQIADLEQLYETTSEICVALSDKPCVDWEWLETYSPIIPSVANGAKGIMAYLSEIRRSITCAKKTGLAHDFVVELRGMVKLLADEI